MNKYRGIALLTVLIFLQLLSILGIFALQMAWLETKQSHAMLQQHLLQNWTEHALSEAENKLNQALPACVIPMTNTADLLKYPRSWWESSVSCAGNFQTFQYYYVVELLGLDPCGLIKGESKKIIADYFRITVLGIMGDMRVILQSSQVIPGNASATKPCEGKYHIVTIGRQMWRRMDGIYQ